MPPMATSGTPAADARLRAARRPSTPTTGSGLVLVRVSKTGPKATYAGRRGERGVELVERVRGDADAEVGGDASHALDGHVRLADVDDVATRELREVGAIVGDERDARAMAHGRQRSQQREDLAGRGVLGAELERRRMRLRARRARRPRDRARAPPASRRRRWRRGLASQLAPHVAPGTLGRQRVSLPPERVTVVVRVTRGRSSSGAGFERHDIAADDGVPRRGGGTLIAVEPHRARAGRRTTARDGEIPAEERLDLALARHGARDDAQPRRRGRGRGRESVDEALAVLSQDEVAEGEPLVPESRGARDRDEPRGQVDRRGPRGTSPSRARAQGSARHAGTERRPSLRRRAGRRARGADGASGRAAQARPPRASREAPT